MKMRNLIWLIVLLAFLGACADNNVATTPGETLAAQATYPAIREGDKGQTVKTAQYLLRYRGQSLAIDGSFGPGTESAVRSFQSRNGLAVDGVVGPNTWGKLIKVSRQGDPVSDAVRAVQSELGITVDGSFGPQTVSAVRSFQSRNGLAVDGVVGPNTWAALVGGSTTPPPTDRASLARQILNNSNVTLGTSSSTPNGNPRQNIVDTANGRAAVSGAGGTVYLTPKMLQGVLNMARSNSLYVTSFAGGGHSSTSAHYKGQAVDIGIWNGRSLSSPNSSHTAARNACIAAGGDRDRSYNAYYDPYGGHSNHVHCAFY